MLRYYAGHFPAVEINNTFYRLPTASMLEGWVEQVPPGFRFVLKASQRITHQRRLKPEAGETLDYLVATSTALGEARGPFLFQLPPNFKKDVERLSAFLALIPKGVEAAFEFRHPSWHEDEVFDTLRSAGAALCTAETDEDTTPLRATTSWGYLRLRREAYDDADLVEWARRIRETAWTDVYVFFKHEDAGTGPRLAHRFEEIFAAAL
jgi:uncharacterized protein YecE (DUF72 family)